MTDYRSLSGAEFQRTVRDDPDKWADAAMIAAEDLGYRIERDWIRSLLADAMEAARKGSIRGVVNHQTEEARRERRRWLIETATALSIPVEALGPALALFDQPPLKSREGDTA